MTGTQGLLFKLGAELLEQPELPFSDDAAAAPAAAAAVSCGSCGLVHSAYAGTPLIQSCSVYDGEQIDRVARGESVPDHRSTCAAETCGHGKVWHSPTNRQHPCDVDGCGCSSFVPKLNAPTVPEPAPLVIVGCGAGKQDRPARARDLYTGQQYRACMATAEALTTPGQIRILSAAHGLLELDTETAPYDVKMGAVGSVTIHQLRQQAERAELLEGRVIILAGAAYTALCRGVWPDAETPLAGLGIGRQRAELAAMRRAAAAADPNRITRQQDKARARHDDAREHRRFCLTCVDGRRCRDGRKLETEARLARDVLRAMLDGEL